MVNAVRTVGPTLWWLVRPQRGPTATALRSYRLSLWWLVRPRADPTSMEYAWIAALLLFVATAAVTLGAELAFQMHNVAGHLVAVAIPAYWH
jgi:hypothetical protein